MRYSALSLAWNALSAHARWKPVWRDPEPRQRYDVVICGGGGHGQKVEGTHKAIPLSILCEGMIVYFCKLNEQ